MQTNRLSSCMSYNAYAKRVIFPVCKGIFTPWFSLEFFVSVRLRRIKPKSDSQFYQIYGSHEKKHNQVKFLH